MKRSSPVLLSCIALSLAGYLFFVRPQINREPSGKGAQEAVRLIYERSLYSAGADFLDTSFIRGVLGIDCAKISAFFVKGIGRQVQDHALSLAPQELIPRHAAAVLELPDAAATGQSFLNSRFGKTLNDISWPTILQRLRIKQSLRRPLEQNASGLMHLLTHSSFSRVFARRLFFARLPPTLPSLLGEEQRRPFPENMLIIMETGREDPKKLFSALLKIPQGSHNTIKHLGFTIHTFKAKQKPKLYMAAVGDRIILSFARQPIKESITLFFNHLFGRKNSLLLNREYMVLAEQRPEKTDFFFYADLFRVKLHLSLLFARFSSQEIIRPWAPGVRSLGFYHHRLDNTDQLKTVVRFLPEQLYPFQRRIYSTPPSLSRIFQDVPADLALSFRFNWLEPRLWWQTTIAHGKKEELASADRIAAWIKEKTDMSMDQFFALFGKNFSVHVAEVSTAGFFPVPRLCFSIEIQDRRKMDEFLQKIIVDLPVKRTIIGGVPVVSLLAAQGMLQPSYTFFNGNLLIADSREQIEDILLKKKTPLIAEKKFQAVDTDPAEPANLQLFARIPELVNALQELASWAGTMIAVRDDQTGSTSKILIDQVITPVLDSFNTYSAIGIRSATAPNELVIDAKVLRAGAAAPSR